MASKFDEKRLKLAAQGLRKTAISLQAAVMSLLRTAEALTAETDDNLVDNNPLDINLQDFLKGNINGALAKLLGDALNNEGEPIDEDQKTQQNGKQSANGVKKPTRKPRPPRDPNAPTRPQTAYILYQKDVASQVKAENQGRPWSEIVHLISLRWRALPKDEKEIYDRQFEEAKKRFEVEYKAYLESKDQAAADADGHEEINNHTSDSTSSTSLSEDENEEDEEDTQNLSQIRSSRSKAKSNAKNMTTSQTDPESSSKKKSKKRKAHEDDDNESAHEEEEYEKSSRKSKKKTSNEEGDEVQGKERKKKKSSREDEDKDASDMAEGEKLKKKKIKKNK